MLKLTKIIFITLLLLGAAHKSVLSVDGQLNLSVTETEFADLVKAADVKLDLNDRASAEQYLIQANQILSQNQNIHIFLQGHYNKVYGKLYMAYDATIALQYFNASVSQFSGNTLEQAEARMFIGITHYYAGSYTLAKSYFEDAKAVFDAQGDLKKSAQATNNLGVVYFRQGNTSSAQNLCQSSLNINTQIENKLNAIRNQQNLAAIAGTLTSSLRIFFENEINSAAGGTGTGTGSTITTSGSGTVVVPTPGG